MQAMGASMSGPDAQARHRALVQAICALGIVHAQYRRALMLAERADGGERRTALAEARRVLGEAVALSGRARAAGLGGRERAGTGVPRAAAAWTRPACFSSAGCLSGHSAVRPTTRVGDWGPANLRSG